MGGLFGFGGRGQLGFGDFFPHTFKKISKNIKSPTECQLKEKKYE